MSSVLTRLVRVIVIAILVGAALCVVATPANASGMNAWPKYILVPGFGSNETAQTTELEIPPSSDVAVLGSHVNLQGGVVNSTHSVQYGTGYFSIVCYTPQRVEVDSPVQNLTIPADSNTSPGVIPVLTVKASLTVPSTCVHIAGLPIDGEASFNMTENGSSGAQEASFLLGSTVPGPGFPSGTGSVTVYRAVSSAELASIEAQGYKYSLAPGVEGKYFFSTLAAAQQAATTYGQMTSSTYTVTSASVAKSAVDQDSYSISVANIGSGWYLVQDGISVIGEVTVQ